MNDMTAAAGEIDRRMSMVDYLNYKAVSSGMCHRILTQSPLHAWMNSPWNPKREPNDSGIADIGTLAHACLLEGGTDNVRVFDPADFPNANGKGAATGWTNKAIREARETARAAGEIPVLRENFDAVQAMVYAAQEYIAQSELSGIFDDGEPEVTLFFDQDGIACKARADFLVTDKRICLSYKTTNGSANPESWSRTQLPMYDVATVFYERAVAAACQSDEVMCVHLVQEQREPYACSLVALSPALRELASAKLDKALSAWSACVASGRFPAYTARICYAEPKAWQVSDFEEKLINSAFSNDELSGGIPL